MEKIVKKLDIIIDLVKRSIAVQLYQTGSSMDDICRNLKMSKTIVVEILNGVKKK